MLEFLAVGYLLLLKPRVDFRMAVITQRNQVVLAIVPSILYLDNMMPASCNIQTSKTFYVNRFIHVMQFMFAQVKLLSFF